ncbi:MAG: hypothetical protein ACXIUD_05345 [Mongoliitalea sp.]
MKNLIAVACLFVSLNAMANDLVNGFVVFSNQDTVQTQIKISGRAPITNSEELVVVQNGEEKVYKATRKEVLAYGFEFAQVSYTYRFFDIKKSYGSGFFRLIEGGENFELYEMKVKGIERELEVANSHYVLRKTSGDYVNFTTSLFGNWKKRLKDFIGDKPEALKELNGLKRNDVAVFVRFLNTLE